MTRPRWYYVDLAILTWLALELAQRECPAVGVVLGGRE